MCTALAQLWFVFMLQQQFWGDAMRVWCECSVIHVRVLMDGNVVGSLG